MNNLQGYRPLILRILLEFDVHDSPSFPPQARGLACDGHPIIDSCPVMSGKLS
jgi:hypothetical protein